MKTVAAHGTLRGLQLSDEIQETPTTRQHLHFPARKNP
jgi:hypothetical protein